MASMLRTRVVISELAFDVLMELEIKQERPLVLMGKSPGRTWTERREYVKQVVAELQKLGLAEDDEPHPDLVAALNVLARPLQQVHGVYAVGDQPPSMIMAAAQGEYGVFACLHDGQLSLEPVSPLALTQPLINVLPELRPIQGQPLRIPVDAAKSDDSTYAGRGGTETAEVKRLLAAERKSAGQFSAALRDQTGRWHRSEFPVSCFDTEEGCFLTQQYRPSSNDGPWLFVAPADARTVAYHAYQALTALKQAATPSR